MLFHGAFRAVGAANLTASSIERPRPDLEKLDSGWAITTIHLDVVGRVPGADNAAFQKQRKCQEWMPVSKVLKANITMTAKLEG